MPEHANDVNWVVVRHGCSPAEMFEKLRLEVEADVKARNDLRPRAPQYGFKFICSSASFSVVREVDKSEGNKTGKSISFHLNGDGIVVKDDHGETLFAATLTLNDQGRCKFKIRNEERESWQVRKLALEDIFFSVPEIPDSHR